MFNNDTHKPCGLPGACSSSMCWIQPPAAPRYSLPSCPPARRAGLSDTTPPPQTTLGRYTKQISCSYHGRSRGEKQLRQNVGPVFWICSFAHAQSTVSACMTYALKSGQKLSNIHKLYILCIAIKSMPSFIFCCDGDNVEDNALLMANKTFNRKNCQ